MAQTFITQIKKTLQGGRAINGKAILAMIIFGMIILTFVLSDITGRKHTGGLGMGAAAEVNGEIITLKEFQEQESRVSAYYAQLFGGKIDNDFQKRQIQAEALNELVSNSLASQGAEKERIYATDAELKKIITEDLPYFKKDGVFQTDLYKGLLSANKLTPGEFEKGLRQDAKTKKVRQLFELGLSASQLDKQLEQELKSKQLNVAYVKISADTVKNSKLVSAAEIQKNLNDAAFAKKVEDYYKTNKAEFETPEQVKASHILIRANPQDAADLVKAQAKAEDALKRLAKEDFAKVAGQISEDPGSKTKNGDVGYFSKGKMVKEFEEAAFTLPIGKVSGIVKTAFGFHIIKVTDKKAATATSFESAKNGIAQKVLAEEKLLTVSKALEALVAKGDKQAIDAYVAQSDLKWTESGYYDLTAEQFPGVNSAQMFKFSLELTKDKPIFKALVREGDAQYILKLVDAKKVDAPVNAKAEELQRRQKATGGYSKWVADLRKSSSITTNNQLMQ